MPENTSQALGNLISNFRAGNWRTSPGLVSPRLTSPKNESLLKRLSSAVVGARPRGASTRSLQPAVGGGGTALQKGSPGESVSDLLAGLENSMQEGRAQNSALLADQIADARASAASPANEAMNRSLLRDLSGQMAQARAAKTDLAGSLGSGPQRAGLAVAGLLALYLVARSQRPKRG